MTTLADLERATARRVGPYYLAYADRQEPTTAGFETVLVPSLRSRIEQDPVTNLWLLRRGTRQGTWPPVYPIWRGLWDPLVTYAANDGVEWELTHWYTRAGIVGDAANLPPDVDQAHWAGYTEPYASFDLPPDDRQRMVAHFDAERGQVTADRPWSTPPLSGEVLEFHHLNPELELREAVRAGLRRCYVEDRYSLGNSYVYEVDLTAALPWLVEPRDIQGVEVAPYPAGNFGGGYGGPQDIPFEVFTQLGHVCLRINSGWGGPYYGGLNVVLRRQVFSLVSGVDTEFGPQRDDDVINVDLDYAVSAAHIEAWHNFPSRLQAAAAGNLQAAQKDAALEFTRQSVRHAPSKRDRYGLKSLYGGGMRLTVVNA